jgi:hypothetical protein
MHAQIHQSLIAFNGGVDKLAQSQGIRLQRARARAFLAAVEQGHTLGPWTAVTSCKADESARCETCSRFVLIVLGTDPVLSGSALTTKCKTF